MEVHTFHRHEGIHINGRHCPTPYVERSGRTAFLASITAFNYGGVVGVGLPLQRVAEDEGWEP